MTWEEIDIYKRYEEWYLEDWYLYNIFESQFNTKEINNKNIIIVNLVCNKSFWESTRFCESLWYNNAIYNIMF